jgi:hypothetical protein
MVGMTVPITWHAEIHLRTAYEVCVFQLKSPSICMLFLLLLVFHYDILSLQNTSVVVNTEFCKTFLSEFNDIYWYYTICLR